MIPDHWTERYFLASDMAESRAFRVTQRRLRGLPLPLSAPSTIPQPWHVAMRAHARR